jgi:hypothetical protein
MGKTAKEEFQRDLRFALTQHLRANDLVLAKRDLDGTALSGFDETEDTAIEALTERVDSIVAALTADWSVEKGSPSSHDHPLYEGPDMVRFKIRTKPRELNEAELAEKTERSARYGWIRSDLSTPPPQGVPFSELLRQTIWWDHTTKIDDLAPGERLRNRKFLLANAGKMHRAAAIQLAGCPDDGVVEHFLDEDPKQWLRGEPLFKRLEELIELDEKRPCGFRWGAPVDYVDEDQIEDSCSMSGDYRHQCGRKHSHKKPHRCLLCQVERDRTSEDTPLAADTKLADVLEQNVWWVTRDGKVLKLVDMEPSHRKHTLAYLKRNATQIADNLVAPYLHDAPDHVVNAAQHLDGWEYLTELPLVKRLAELVAADEKAES